MSDRPALLGGEPAVSLAPRLCCEWPRYGDEDLEALRQYFAAGPHGNHPGPGHPCVDLEQVVAERWGVKYVLNHNSGTSAIKTALFAVGVVPGDEVIAQYRAAFDKVARHAAELAGTGG